MNKEAFIQMYSANVDVWTMLRADENKRNALDYLKNRYVSKILYRLVDSCTLSIDSYWYNGQPVDVSEAKSVMCGKYTLMLLD